MPDKIRKQLYIERRHEQMLKERSADLKITEAEIMRDALDVYTAYSTSSGPWLSRDRTAWAREKEFISGLKHSTGQSSNSSAATAKKSSWRRDELHER
jgi:hypothetical protein